MLPSLFPLLTKRCSATSEPVPQKKKGKKILITEEDSNQNKHKIAPVRSKRRSKRITRTLLFFVYGAIRKSFFLGNRSVVFPRSFQEINQPQSQWRGYLR